MKTKSKLILAIIIVIFLDSCNKAGIDGKKVFFGTPAGYAERLAEEIHKAGGIPFSLPLIETVIPDVNPAIDSLLNHLDEIDFIAFSSRKAIEALFEKADSSDIKLLDEGSIKLCTIGKDSELLKNKYGLKPFIQPAEPSPRGIINELSELEGIKGKNIAVLAPSVRHIPEPDVVPDFIAGLEEIGMNVKRVDAYYTALAKELDFEEYRDKLAKGYYDVIAFTSTAEIEVFLLLMNDRHIADKQVIACFGPYTAANALELGLHVDVVADDFSSFAGLIESIDLYFSGL